MSTADGPLLPFDTATAAHLRIASTKQETYTCILHIYLARGREGYTADEAARVLGCDKDHSSPRVSELLKAGLLRDSGRRRKTRKGSWAAVLVHFEFADSGDRDG